MSVNCPPLANRAQAFPHQTYQPTCSELPFGQQEVQPTLCGPLTVHPSLPPNAPAGHSPPATTQAKVITGEDCDDLRYISDVVGAQNGKSPEVVSKSAAVLSRHGFEKESRLLAGRQSTLIICLCYVVRTVSFDSHFVASTTAH